MSAFVCILDRSGGTVDARELERLAGLLASYGSELAAFCRGPVGIAIRHRGGPGALERHGPRVDPGTGRVAAVAGRLWPVDEAPEAAPAVGLLEGAGAAAFALSRAAHPDPGRELDLLAGLCGSFVLIAADPAAGWLRVARDHLGNLKVYYFLDRRWLIAASEPAAVLAHGAVSDELDEGTAARFLGFRFGHTERSFFRQVRELPPAHCLWVTADEARAERYWRFRRLRPAAAVSTEEVAEGFLRRLGRSVGDHAAGLEPERVGVSLSGGLDSTAVAAVAPPGVRTFSWTLEQTPEGDERAQVEAVARHLDLPLRRVPGDGLYPLCGDFAERFVHPGSPYVNPFAALKWRLYETARAEGCERVLVGDGGDALYAAGEYWLRDLLAGARPGALASLAGALRRAARGDRLARLALVRVLPVRGLRTALRPDPIPWLTAAGRAALPPNGPSPILPPGCRRRARYELSGGAKHTEVESEEQRFFALCGIDRANPYRSWPLLEWAIQLPAYWLHRDGRTKVLAREALRGRLPEPVIESPRIGLLGTFFLRGLELRRDEVLEAVFRRPRSDWRRWVRPEWVEPYLSATRSVAFGHTILWRVISYELWHRRLIGRA